MRLIGVWLVTLLLLVGSLAAQTTYSYSYVPKQIYATQIFPVTIIADSIDNKTPPRFYFDRDSSIKPINTTPMKDENDHNTFFTFYFKAPQNDIRVPILTIVDRGQTVSLKSKYIPVKLLDTSAQPKFCGLIATSCKVLNLQVSPFDDNRTLVSAILKVTEGNVRELKIADSLEDGIEKLTTNGASSTIEYYFVIPSKIKEVTTSYFNTLQGRFITKKIATDFQNKPVAAQENLNPIDSSFDKVKKYGMIFMTFLLLVMLLIRRESFYLILFLVGVVIIFNMFRSRDKICIEEGALLYILPTSISTIGGHIDRDIETDILNKRGEYYKIEYDNGIIGWIKHENICKD